MSTWTDARTSDPSAGGTTGADIAHGRQRRLRRRRRITAALALIVLALVAVSLMFGNTFYSPAEVIRVILGEDVPGASFTVGDLRLPRSCLAVVAGMSFGMAGVTFQTMLRNPLAAPDVIGISSGASAAAVFAIVVLSLTGTVVSLAAIVAAVSTASVIYLLAYKDGLVGARLILIGIGIAAVLDSVVAYVLVRASTWDLQTAMRWLTGSLNGATWADFVPLAIAFAVFGPTLLALARNLEALRLGEDAAAAIGVRVERTRLVAILAAVALIAFATAATGPIAFVAFLSGPIAARIAGSGGTLTLQSGFVGAGLVLAADFAGQWLFGTRYPVGVITGALGAPYLVYLLIRTNRAGGSL